MRAERYCPDCGPATVSHAVERWTVRTDALFGHIMRPIDVVWKTMRPVATRLRLGRMAPPIVKVLAAVRLGNIVSKPDDKTTLRALVVWNEAERRGIVMREFRPFGLSRELFYATYGDDTLFFDGLPRPRGSNEDALDWMDDKGIVLERFGKAGVPVPKGGKAKTKHQAEKVFAEIDPPAVVKPAIGSRSRHTYTDVKDLSGLIQAFEKAKELSPSVVIEENIPGFVFRITLVGGKVAGVIRREPPHVTGDGKHTVRELIQKENENPMRQGPIFHVIDLGKETDEALKTQSLTMDDVPKKDRMVILHSKVSRVYGASTTEIANVHPENHDLFEKVAELLNDPIVGVDFIADDMTKPWHMQRCGVIECNSLPFIDLHHYPLNGPVVNVAGMVWDLVFPASGKAEVKA